MINEEDALQQIKNSLGLNITISVSSLQNPSVLFQKNDISLKRNAVLYKELNNGSNIYKYVTTEYEISTVNSLIKFGSYEGDLFIFKDDELLVQAKVTDDSRRLEPLISFTTIEDGKTYVMFNVMSDTMGVKSLNKNGSIKSYGSFIILSLNKDNSYSFQYMYGSVEKPMNPYFSSLIQSNEGHPSIIVYNAGVGKEDVRLPKKFKDLKEYMKEDEEEYIETSGINADGVMFIFDVLDNRVISFSQNGVDELATRYNIKDIVVEISEGNSLNINYV